MTKPVAVIAAHPDDEVLGCGGTIARFAAEGRAVHVLLMADGESARIDPDDQPIDAALVAARDSAAHAACELLDCASVETLALPDNRLDGLQLLDVIKHIEAFLVRHSPSTVLTHHAGDVNIDHRVVHSAVTSACRPHPGQSVRELLFFEVPSSTEWAPPGSGEPFAPTWFVDISTTLATKIKALGPYASEMREFPHPRSLIAVEMLARHRGASVGIEAAEAFVLGRRIVE